MCSRGDSQRCRWLPTSLQNSKAAHLAAHTGFRARQLASLSKKKSKSRKDSKEKNMLFLFTGGMHFPSVKNDGKCTLLTTGKCVPRKSKEVRVWFPSRGGALAAKFTEQ
jgi:hypothetical protein